MPDGFIRAVAGAPLCLAVQLGVHAECTIVNDSVICWKPAGRFTKYLTTILRLSYDNAKVTIDLR